MRDTIDMAREAGMTGLEDGGLVDNFLVFEALVRADEREACARVCEKMWHRWLDSPEENEPNKPDAEDCYRAIRARGNT